MNLNNLKIWQHWNQPIHTHSAHSLKCLSSYREFISYFGKNSFRFFLSRKFQIFQTGKLNKNFQKSISLKSEYSFAFISF